MKISIVTPTLNRADYLSECIESVVNQKYDAVEHVIVDGGSTDGTIELLRSMTAKYGDRIRWSSQPDRGISHAVNRGFQMATGDVIGWIGSDDKLADGSLAKVAQCFLENPPALWLYGSFFILDGQGKFMRMKKAEPFNYRKFLRSGYICGPSVFVRKDFAQKAGPIREDLECAMDFEWCLRMAAVAEPYKLDEVLAGFRWHPGCVTMTRRLAQLDEGLKSSLPYAGSLTDRGLLILSNKFYKLRAWAWRLLWRFQLNASRA